MTREWLERLDVTIYNNVLGKSVLLNDIESKIIPQKKNKFPPMIYSFL